MDVGFDSALARSASSEMTKEQAQVVSNDAERERRARQIAGFGRKQFAGGEIGLFNSTGTVECDVADWRKLIQIGIAPDRHFQIPARNTSRLSHAAVCLAVAPTPRTVALRPVGAVSTSSRLSLSGNFRLVHTPGTNSRPWVSILPAKGPTRKTKKPPRQSCRRGGAGEVTGSRENKR